jgi:hypothetical protein
MPKVNWQLPVIYKTSCQYSRVVFKTLKTSLRQYLDYENWQSEDIDFFSIRMKYFHLSKLGFICINSATDHLLNGLHAMKGTQ